MKCPTCGKEIAEDSKFCVYCGAEFIPVELKKEAKEVLTELVQPDTAFLFKASRGMALEELCEFVRGLV